MSNSRERASFRHSAAKNQDQGQNQSGFRFEGDDLFDDEPLDVVSASVGSEQTPLNENLLQGQVVFEFSRAVLVGATQGVSNAIVGMVEDCLHPIDNVIYPISSFLYDATIISAGHLNAHDIPAHFNEYSDAIDIARQAVMSNPQLYQEATNRMDDRVNQLKTAGQHFEEAAWPEKVRIATMAITSIGTTIYTPGVMINSVKAMINVQQYGVPFNPPNFHYWMERPREIRAAPTYALSEVRAIRGQHPCLYAIMQDEQLIIAPQYIPEAVVREVAGNKVTRIVRREIKHSEVTGCAPVKVAGELKIEDGLVRAFDPNSGRYFPFGEHLKRYAESIFVENGYHEAAGKFVESSHRVSSLAIKTPDRMNFTPPGSVSSGLVLSVINDGLKNNAERQTTSRMLTSMGFSESVTSRLNHTHTHTHTHTKQ